MTLLPCVGDDVVLDVAGREKLLSRVVDTGAGTLDLDLLESPRTPRAQLERSALFIDFINDEGYARLHGRADTRLDPDDHHAQRAADALRFAHRGQPLLMQRRGQLRAEARLPLRVARFGPGERRSSVIHTVDLSGGGMLVRGLPSPTIGDEYGFDLELTEGSLPISGRFRVVGIAGEDRADVQFTALQHEDRTRIMQFAMEAAQVRRRGVH
jgi:hypothetical protein